MPIFLNSDHEHRHVELAQVFLAFSGKVRDLQRLGEVGRNLGTTLARRESGQIAAFELAPPGVGCFKDAKLVGIGELSASGVRHHFGVDCGSHTKRRRFARRFSRPAGSLRDERIRRTLDCVRGYLGVMIDFHS